MKIKIIINTVEMLPDNENDLIRRTSEVWSGEMDILPKNEYLTKISIIAEGINEPICEVPFSIGEGYYQWIPPLMNNEKQEETQERIIENTEPL